MFVVPLNVVVLLVTMSNWVRFALPEKVVVAPFATRPVDKVVVPKVSVKFRKPLVLFT